MELVKTGNEVSNPVKLFISGIKMHTAKAILVLIDEEDYWLPLSQIEEYTREYVVISEWLAKEKELI